MKIYHSSQQRPLRFVAIATGIIVVAMLGWLAYAYSQQKWPFATQTTDSATAPQNTVDYNEPTEDQVSAGVAAKEKVAKDATTPSTEPSSTPTIPVSFTSVQPGETVYIRTLIGAVTSGATCSLTMSGPNSKSYTASTGVQALSSSSTCQGFNVPMSNLAPGNWTITVIVTDGASTGAATTEKTL